MIRMTYEIAHAVAWDDADRHMRKHGRKHWNRDDYKVALRKIEDLLPSNLAKGRR